MALSKSEIQSIFEKALSPAEAKQVEFLQKLDTIVKGFPTQWVKTNLISFLTNWLPRDNKNVATELGNRFKLLVGLDKNPFYLFSLVELLVGFDDPKITNSVLEALLQSDSKSDAKAFIESCLRSNFDSVRAFGPSLIQWISSDIQQLEILKLYLTSPETVVIVRLSVVRALQKVKESVAKEIASILIKDPSSKVRGGIPFFCSGFSFFGQTLVHSLASDQDWYVRSSVASQLPNVADVSISIPFLQNLIGDKVWQVQINALRSLTKVLKPGASHEGLPAIFKMFIDILNISQENLRFATIDAFMSVYSIIGFSSFESDCKAFVSKIIEHQPHPIQLHLLKKLSESKEKQLFGLIVPYFRQLVVQLIASPKWRIRKGIVEILFTLHSIDSTFDKQNEIVTLLTNLVEDKAATVRAAVVEQLYKFHSSKSEGTLPSYYSDMKQSKTFRRRQAALEFLELVAKNASDAKSKSITLEEIKSFFKDPCKNVVLFAQGIISALSQ